MEFVKVRNGYLIKNGNGRIISEKEKLEIENHELVLEDINSSDCVKEITKKISKNKKRIKELEEKEELKKVVNNSYKKMLKEEFKEFYKNEETALEKKVQNENIIEEAK